MTIETGAARLNAAAHDQPCLAQNKRGWKYTKSTQYNKLSGE
jgi:hypothetical protein